MPKICPRCNYSNSDDRFTCINCGENLNSAPFNQNSVNSFLNTNFPGLEEVHNPPPELKGWNWGAFALTFFWGIANQTYWALLCLVPYVGIVASIYYGIYGNAWAWKSGRFRTPQECMECQKIWNKWGLVLFIVGIGLSFVFSIIFCLVYLFLMSKTLS
ncbi:MAG: ribonuclease G [Abditibacteriota bacterium]|nr:ribonuclease G [Abditibacteriota bacterium]